MVTIFKKYKSFYGFYKTFAFIYQFFAISPKCADDTPGKPHSCTKLLIGLFLFLYWIGVGIALCRTELPNNSVSIASNFIQLLLNALALTAALINPLWKYSEYHEMIQLLEKIDHQFSEIKRAIDYRRQVKIFFALTSAFLFLIIYNYAFDFYVAIYKNGVQVPYWILYSIPLIVYAASVHQAIFFIFSIHKRLQMTSELLNLNGPILEEGNNRWLESSEISPINCFPINGRVHQPKNTPENKIFRLIKDIYLLCSTVDKYFGIVLLLALGALFSVASIQSFYCFMITAHFDPTKNRTVWTLIACINLILINMLLVVGLSCASEMVTYDVNCILAIVLEMQPTNKVRQKDLCRL